MIDPSTLSDLQIVARTIYGEDRGGGAEGMQAVANVIFNRARLNWQGETTARGVCLHRYQFDCWMLSDPNYPKLLADDFNEQDPSYLIALDLASQGFAGALQDNTGGSTAYYAKSTPKPPFWAKGITPKADIGNQLFFVLSA